MSNINFSNTYLNQLDRLSKIINRFGYNERLYNSPLLKATENISRLTTINKDLYHAIEMQERIYNSPLLNAGENINQIATINTDLFQAIELQSRIYNQTFESLQNVVDNLNWDKGLTETISRIVNMQISWRDTVHVIREMGQVVEDYNWIEEVEEVSEQDIKDISEADYQELCEVIESIRPDRLNWQQRLVKSYEDFKEKNPVIEGVLRYLIISVIGAILINVASQYIGELRSGAKIKTEPTANAPTIIIVEKNMIVNIIADVPYYYEVITEDEFSKEEIRGWVSKRSTDIK